MLKFGVLDNCLPVGGQSARNNIISVSHLPVPPPIWASLPEDGLNAHTRAQPVLQVPGTISMDDGAHCICGSSRQLLDQTALRECVVYTLVGAQRTLLEVQPCRKCPPFLRRFIGPDGLQLGLFNLNNSILFTHDLLDDYTANFTSSETPFSAWVSVMRKRYLCYGSLLPFPHEAVLRNAWFSYSALLHLDGDMKCPKCGPTPDNVVWDGVSLSFHRKHLLPSLTPPTTVHERSLIRGSRYRVQAPIAGSDLRCAMRNILAAASTPTMSESAGQALDSARNPRTEVSGTSTIGIVEKVAHDTASLIELVLKSHALLKLVNDSLAACFYSHIGLAAMNPGTSLCKEYANLFVQVRIIR